MRSRDRLLATIRPILLVVATILAVISGSFLGSAFFSDLGASAESPVGASTVAGFPASIVLPSAMPDLVSGASSAIRQDKEFYVVSFLTPTCMQCISNLADWMYYRDGTLTELGAELILIVNGPSRAYSAAVTRDYLEDLPITIHYDSLGLFSSAAGLPPGKIPSTVLLDKEGSVLLSGTPIGAPRIASEYERRMRPAEPLGS